MAWSRRVRGGAFPSRTAHFPFPDTLPLTFRRKVVSKSVDKEAATPDYVRIGNNLIASNHSPNCPILAANRNTVRRA